jgi:predicted nucleic acid-binding protein
MVPGDQHEARAREAFASLPQEARVIVPAPVLQELHQLIVHRKPRNPSYALRAVTKVLEVYPLVFHTQGDVKTALELLAQYPDQTITLADAMLVSMAKREGARVLTFDHRHFGLMGAEVYQ